MPVKRHSAPSSARWAWLGAVLLLIFGSAAAPISAYSVPRAPSERAGGVAAAALTSLAVTSTSDVADGNTSSFDALAAQPGADGAISLREALRAANAMAESLALTIEFNIPTDDPGYASASGTWTIKLGAQALPPFARGNLKLDGSSQPGSSSQPRIVLDGFDVYEAAGLSNGITITSARNTVRGLTLANFYDDAILIDGPNAAFNQITGNYIGTSATGGAPAQASYFGVEIRNGAHDNTIGGSGTAARNVISGNANSGVLIQGSATKNNAIVNNRIGTNPSGTAALPNAFAGVMISAGAASNTIGGSGRGNLISGNDTGIYIDGAANTVIVGNTIGLAANGTTPLANTDGGIFLVNGAHDTVIGGSSSGLRNVISGNGSTSSPSGQGIYLADTETTKNTIIGNYIGVDASGQRPAGNFRQGVMIGIGAQNNRVGGTATGEANVIAYNGQGGVRIDSPNNQLIGNLIGVGADGTTQLGNQVNGVRVGGNNNTIGPSNLIAYNQHSGVFVLGSNTTVLSNTIQSNGRSGVCVAGAFTTIDHNIIKDNGTGAGPWPECPIQSGVVITDTTNALVTNNQIFSNNAAGITVYGGVSNRILSNSISDNQSSGIRLVRGGNDEVAPPQIRSIQPTGVSGTSCASCRVELFTDDNDEGRNFIGTTTASATGNFSLSIGVAGLHAPHMTATHTDVQGNTSPFAPAVIIPRSTGDVPTPTPQLPQRPGGGSKIVFLPILAH